MSFTEGWLADVTGGCWSLLTIMTLSWLRTICVPYTGRHIAFASFVYTFTKGQIPLRYPGRRPVADLVAYLAFDKFVRVCDQFATS